jgi:hypothetical protein
MAEGVILHSFEPKFHEIQMINLLFVVIFDFKCNIIYENRPCPFECRIYLGI